MCIITANGDGASQKCGTVLNFSYDSKKAADYGVLTCHISLRETSSRRLTSCRIRDESIPQDCTADPLKHPSSVVRAHAQEGQLHSTSLRDEFFVALRS